MSYNSIEDLKNAGKPVLVDGGYIYNQFVSSYTPTTDYELPKAEKKESPWKIKPKKCTHEHAFRGTCLTCGEENV